MSDSFKVVSSSDDQTRDAGAALIACNVCHKVRDAKSGDSFCLTLPKLVIPRGKTTVLQGPSGSGKTTLLQLLGLVSPPTTQSPAAAPPWG